uniref:Integrase catalytic domain-containing protein n=1 Tax=Tanacetum cinerariifolium TaxID=118510 RepID=A0A6L2LN49_TANCI|nr:hypothetical protein [Tanacetum cinerariifolium]
MPHVRMSPGEHEELRRQVKELISKGHVRERMSPCAQPREPLDLMSLHVSCFVPKKVHDFVEGLPYHGDSSNDDLVGKDFIKKINSHNDPGVNESSELFALACGPSQTPISVNSCVVNDVRFVMHSRDERRTTQNSDICLPSPDREMYYGQLEQILEFSYLSFKTVLFRVKCLNDLEIAALHIDGQSTDVDAPPDIIDVIDEDDDIIDEEDPIPHDLVDFDDEDLVNLDIDDGVNISTDVARGHSGDNGDDHHPRPYQVPIGYEGCLGNRGHLKVQFGWHESGQTAYLPGDLEPRVKGHQGKSDPVPIHFEVDDRETLMPLGNHAAHWANYLGELVREFPLHYPSWCQMPPEWKARVVVKIGMETSATREYPSLIHTFFLTHTVGGVFLNPEDKALYDEMLRLQGLGSNTLMGVPYTKDEIMAIVREGKQRGHILGVGQVFPGQGLIIPPLSQSTHSANIARLKKSEKRLTKQVNMFMSGSGGCEDGEPRDDEDGGEDEDDNPIMSDTVPPIPLPFRANTGNPSNPNRAGNPTDNINTTTTTNVVQNVVDENLPQLLDSRGGLKAEIVVLTKKIDVMNKGKSEKGLVAKSFDWDDESVSFNDEGVTTFKALMAVADEELSVGRTDPRSGQYVEITMQKALGGKGMKKEKFFSKEVIFTKSDVSTSETYFKIPSDSESEACKKGKHHRASFKTNRSFSINKCVHLFHIDLFGTIKPQSISHNKYTLVIVDEYPRYTWVFCLKKNSDAANCIISFIRKMENLNEVKVKEMRSDNGTKFKNLRLEEFYDEKGISQNFSSSCTPEQNGVAERRNKTLIEWPKHSGSSTSEDKKWKITYHVTFSKEDEAISLSSTKGDAINFNENRVRDSEATSAHDCLYVNFLSEIKPKRLIEDLKEEEWVITMQEELNQFEETRLEAIKIFLAYTAYMGFMVYQMDVNSEFLNVKISKEVYVQQPPGFESSEFPNHVCKLDKALYGLKQALRAWYETLLKFLFQYKFVRGFQIKKDFKGISICQEKYVKDLLKKYELADSASVKCLMLSPTNLGPDESGVSVNETVFRGMIGSLMYLTASRLDIQFSTCLYARYQANPKESHLVAVKRIFRYLKGTLNLGLWYPKGSSFDLKAYSDLDYARCNLDRKTEAKYVVATRCCAQVLWIKRQLASYDVLYDKAPIFYDNTNAISILNNPVLHSRTKHINIRLGLYKGFSPLTSHNTVKDTIATLALAEEKNPEKTSVGLAHSSPLRVRYFSPTWKVLMVYLVKYLGGSGHRHSWYPILCITKLSFGGNNGREKNICFVRYLSLVMEHLMGAAYVNEDLKPIKSFQVTDGTFKNSKIFEVLLTSYLHIVAKHQENPLVLPSEEVNVEGINDKSSSRTTVHPVHENIIRGTETNVEENVDDDKPVDDAMDTELNLFKDKTISRSVFESDTSEYEADDNQSQHIEMTKSEEKDADNILDE